MRNRDQTGNNSNFLTPTDSETSAGLMDIWTNEQMDGE